MRTEPEPARWWMAVALACILLVAACVATAPPQEGQAGNEEGSAAEAPPEDDRSGAELWAERCSLCHNLRSPASLSDAQWDAVTRHMRVRAYLTGMEETKIRAFLQSAN